MSELVRIIRAHPHRTLIYGAGICVSIFAFRAFWRHLIASSSGKKLPRLKNEKWKLSNRCEIDISALNAAIDGLEQLLVELEPNKFHSELGRGKYDLIASIIARLHGVCSDLQKYVSDDFRKKVSMEDIARSVWNKKNTTGRQGGAGTLSVLSDTSFQSACDEFIGVQPGAEDRASSLCIDHSTMALYNEGMKALESGEITYRKSRAEFSCCESDSDFAAKLFGLRLAFRRIMDDPQMVQWLIQSGRIIIADLLRHDKKDPAEFYAVYDRMIAFLSDEKNVDTIREELKIRRVESTNLWDALFDLIILDAFEDLQKPPSSISALLRNGFISRSMKESTLNNLIWSLIKVKRQRSTFVKDGFISHFYDISQIITCSLTMGLLGGSAKEFQDLCVFFKEQIFALIIDMFDTAKVHYTTVEELAEDVKKLLTDRVELIKIKMSTELLPI